MTEQADNLKYKGGCGCGNECGCGGSADDVVMEETYEIEAGMHELESGSEKSCCHSDDEGHVCCGGH